MSLCFILLLEVKEEELIAKESKLFWKWPEY